MEQHNEIADLNFGAGPCGIINVVKPSGCTSRDVVNNVQRTLGRKVKVGHAGTLDPMANGVLLICVGKATRLIPLIHRYSKAYLAEFTLGSISDTDDATGSVTVEQVEMPDQATLESSLQSQVGTLMQIPPAYSAVKVDGKRAYRSAREGKVVEISPRAVTVHQIDLLQYSPPGLTVRIDCASGTYIRSIARDLGEKLGTGGLMSSLTRENIGPFLLQLAIAAEGDSEHWLSNLKEVNVLFSDFPKHELKMPDMLALKDGKRIVLQSTAKEIAAFYQNRFGALLELEKSTEGGSQYKASHNWVPAWFQA